MPDFDKEVKHALVDKGLTQKKLSELISEKLSIKADRHYINSVIRGKRISPAVTAAIKEILNL